MAIRRDSRGLAKGRKGGSPLVFRFDTPAAVCVSIAPDGQSNRENLGKGAIWWEPAEQYKRGSPNTSSSLECHYCVCVHRWTLAVFLLWEFFNGSYTPPLDVPIHNHKREAVSLSLPVRAALILYNSPIEEEEEEKKRPSCQRDVFWNSQRRRAPIEQWILIFPLIYVNLILFSLECFKQSRKWDTKE